MTELSFDAAVLWTGRARRGAGTVATGGLELEYSAPQSMGGRGIGTSPEELLVSAVASCYAATLFHLLARDDLPAEQVWVRVGGVVSDYPSQARFSRITVHPTITRGDPVRRQEYEACARLARQHCFIGKALQESILYDVGEVVIRPDEAMWEHNPDDKGGATAPATATTLRT